MGIWKRVGSILRSQKKEPQSTPDNPYEDTAIHDVVIVDLEEFVVDGKVSYYDRGFPPHRYLYYLRSGSRRSVLVVEKGHNYECYLCHFLEGAPNDIHDIPSTLDIEEYGTFELESERNDLAQVQGRTDFRSQDEILWWKFFSDDNFFFLEWQDGKFIGLLGELLPAAAVSFISASDA